MKKILYILTRDLKVNTRDFLALYIMVFPILLAVLVNIFTPGVNDTTINIALLEGDSPDTIAYYQNFAKVELYNNKDEITDRVSRRDAIFGIVPDKDGNSYIIAQGNEGEHSLQYAKVLKSLRDLNIDIEDANAEIKDFNKTVPPLKKTLVAIGVLFTAALGGMLIAFNVIEEKVDRTIKAVQVSTVSRKQFLIGKSLIGILVPILGSVALLLITGFNNINFGQMAILIFTSSIITILIGFIEGIRNEDIMSAAAGVKLVFLPIFASVAVYEMLAQKWQYFFYWSPFYWTYKGLDQTLSHTATWGSILLYAGIVTAISAVVYFILAPKIRKGLE